MEASAPGSGAFAAVGGGGGAAVPPNDDERLLQLLETATSNVEEALLKPDALAKVDEELAARCAL
ncbi:hypothetical protein M885DRAFT_572343 [Pelagophyceae sp. CCMP2097]|nr:hypothetical protein M885DRAFT_572343 [Pelagophyceae sp. CCMP2097]